MSSSKKLTNNGTLRQAFICLRPHILLGFCLGVVYSNFVGSESGRIQGDKLLQNMVSSRTQLYVLYVDTGKGGGGDEPERR